MSATVDDYSTVTAADVSWSLNPALSARGVMDKAAFVAGLHHATLVAALVAAVGAAVTGWLVDRNLRDGREDVVPVDEAVAEEAAPSLV